MPRANTAPVVLPFFSLLDVLQGADHRFSVLHPICLKLSDICATSVKTAAENTTDSDFDLELITWGDSQVWSASCSYLAFGVPGHT